MLLSEKFSEMTKRRFLFSIMPIDNMFSVLKNGLLCYNKVKQIQHTSIAMNEVQKRRDAKIVRGGLPLHDYANLYFDFWNPMLYKRKAQNPDICILVFAKEILNIPNCVVSDRNAASPYARFYSVEDGLKCLDFKRIYAKFWTDSDPYLQDENKKIKCAEVLVPYRISSEYIIGAMVYDEQVEEKMLALGFNRKIAVTQDRFF